MSASGRGGFSQTLELRVLVHKAERDWPASCYSMIDSGIHDHAVGLELLPFSPPISPLPALQLAVDHHRVQGHTRWEPFHDGRQRLAMRFTGGQVAEHCKLPDEDTRRSTDRRPNHSDPRKWTSSQAFEGLDVPLARAGDHVIGKPGRRAGLVPSSRLQPVPHELLVERCLGTAWTISIAPSSESYRE